MSALNGNYRIFCAGNDGSRRWLKPKDLTKVSLEKESSLWQLEQTDKGYYTIHRNGSYLAGNTKEGRVDLVPLEGQTGVNWQVEPQGEYYAIRCLSTGEGDKRYLDGDTGDSKVYLHADTTRSGSQWLLIPA
jgi:hypothetical protein